MRRVIEAEEDVDEGGGRLRKRATRRRMGSRTMMRRTGKVLAMRSGAAALSFGQVGTPRLS